MLKHHIASNKIHLLPEHISNHIAAGEVVQRPSNIVKELLENSIDAGATEIQMHILHGGKTLLEIIDNGSGMNMYDARMAFERHATSKIKSIEDIVAIQTMGFRGEALASIAAVAQVELKTRTKEQEEGTLLRIEQNKIIKQAPCATKVGTSLQVKNLFFHIPARKHFLKSDYTELKHIVSEFTRIALSHPGIAFSFTSNKEVLFQLSAGSLKQRILQLFGKTIEENLLSVDYVAESISISGFIGKPSIAKRSKADTFLVVNKRYVRSLFITKAIASGYGTLLQETHTPFFVLHLEVNPQEIDINIHPSKQEIKFADEKWLFALVQSQVKYCLAKSNINHPIQFDLDKETSRVIGQSYPNKLLDTKATQALVQNFSKKNQGHYLETNWKNDIKDILPITQRETFPDIQKSKNSDEVAQFDSSLSTNYKQLLKSFVLVEQSHRAYIMDQQRAHQRIIYEELLKKLQSPKNDTEQTTSQTLVKPLSIHLSPQHIKVLNHYKEALKQGGYHIESIGLHDIAVYATPKRDMPARDVQEAIISFVESDSITTQKNNEQERIAWMWAKSHAISSNISLQTNQIESLVNTFFALPHTNLSIDGKPIYQIITPENLRQLLL